MLNVACNWVHDLKEMREQASQNPANSSRPYSTRAPWESGKKSIGAGAPQESGKNAGVGESDLAEPSESLDREDRKDQTEATEHSAAPETKTGSNAALTPVIHASEKRKQGKQLGDPGYGRTWSPPEQVTPVTRRGKIRIRDEFRVSNFGGGRE